MIITLKLPSTSDCECPISSVEVWSFFSLSFFSQLSNWILFFLLISVISSLFFGFDYFSFFFFCFHPSFFRTWMLQHIRNFLNLFLNLCYHLDAVLFVFLLEFPWQVCGLNQCSDTYLTGTKIGRKIENVVKKEIYNVQAIFNYWYQ